MSDGTVIRTLRWEMECNLADGARIGRLAYAGVDLLTTAPAGFRPPTADYGRYETRPVYGYDDCFPTVEACGDWPDHGELCWLKWSGSPADCTVTSALAPLRFNRRLEFAPDRLRWHFAVANLGATPCAVQHVMHPLMPLGEVVDLVLPAGDGYDAARVAADLLSLEHSQTRMLYLPKVRQGQVRIGFREGLQLKVRFPTDLFPTLAIWWNHLAYPDEAGLRRSECAFEPVPGPDSRLANGTTMVVPANGALNWSIDWEVSCP